MTQRLATAGYWALAATFCLVLAVAWVAERWQPAPVGQPDEPPEVLGEIQQHSATGDLIGARARVLEVIDESPELAAAHGMLAQVEYSLGDSRAAINALRRAVALDPDEIPYRQSLSEIYSNLGWFVRAEEQLSEILEQDPDNLQALRSRSELFFQTGRHNEAMADLDFAVQSHGEDPLAFYSRARMKLLLGNVEGVEADLGQIEQLGGEDWAGSVAQLRRDFGLR